MAGDCFGDAVNVAARLLDHAGDNETLITAPVLAGLTPRAEADVPQPRPDGAARPCRAGAGLRATAVGAAATARPRSSATSRPPSEPDAIRLEWLELNQVFASRQMPVVLGRSPQAHYCVDDSRVSRSHARLDWHGGSFQLSDLSYNGTYVRFADGEIVSLRRGSCLLHGSGAIGLGGSPADPTSACVRFEVLRFGDTESQPLA